MIRSIAQLCLVLVLISDRYYVNTDRIDYIDAKEKWVKVGNETFKAMDYWYLKVTDTDIEKLKAAMGVHE
jgi:hypothetical protein